MQLHTFLTRIHFFYIFYVVNGSSNAYESVKDILPLLMFGLDQSIFIYAGEADYYYNANIAVELVKLLAVIYFLIYINNVVFKPLVDKLTSESSRTVAMLNFLPPDLLISGDYLRKPKRR